MEQSPPESHSSPHELSPADPRPPERRSARRRLVQSTLFPLKTPAKDAEENGDVKAERDYGENVDDGGDGNGGDEECWGSQSKRKRKPKGKTTPSKKSSEKVKGKRSVDTTPKKNLANLLTEEAPLVVPNLRLEAKLTAEENSRIFAGRQLHPFFSSWKACKKNPEGNEGEEKQGAVCRDNKEINLGPIHVFEKAQGNDVALDWGNWTLYDRIFSNSSFAVESTCKSIVEGSVVECLTIDNCPVISKPSITSIYRDEDISDQCDITEECTTATVSAAPTIQDKEKMISNQPVKHVKDNKVNGVDSSTWYTDEGRITEIGKGSRFLEERMKLYYLGCGSQPSDSLWTNKYQPKKAIEVCGNDESVNFLTEWLQQWCERESQISRDIDCDAEKIQEDEYTCSASDSDEGNKHEETGLKNVLLVTGPVGSGKSAAIYACAREQGYEILEVNASDCRNGALVKQRFGEALESRQLKRSLANPMGSPNKHIVKPPSALPNGKATQKTDIDVADLICLSDEDCDLQNGEGGSLTGQHEVKPLILFEDADITFLDDRGFIAAVQQISKTAKGPIILTSNSHNPLLPENLNRHKICFELPSPKDLLSHVYMICGAERANVQSCLLEQLIECCEGDIRKAIMHLQFWCQGKSPTKAKSIQGTPDSRLFDLESGHKLLPKLVPWDLPSQLSELVEKEISESLLREEAIDSMAVVEEEESDQNETYHTFMHYNDHNETIEAKKAEMLSRNCTFNDYDELRAQLDTVHETSDNPDTPFSCFRSNHRKQHDTISSDSEDELANKENPNHYAESETVIPMDFDECQSLDVSRVPESSFVPETIMIDGIEVNCRNESSYLLNEEVSVSNMDILLKRQHDSEPVIGSQSVILELCEEEEVEDSSQNDHAGSLSIRYQLMDEYSRMGFKRLTKSAEKSKPGVLTYSVQKSWDKLRNGADLAQYVRSETKQYTQIINLAHEMSDLMSETDLLLSTGKLLASDSLEQSSTQPEESDMYSLYEASQLASTTAEHGFCFYVRKVASLGSNLGFENTEALASEVLESLKETHKSARQDIRSDSNKSELFEMLQSIIPPKSYTTVKGDAFYEYLSSLRCISRSEASRLSQLNQKPGKRRRRADRHYLSSTVMFSPEEISSIDRISSFRES